jgi:hypothetical protein
MPFFAMNLFDQSECIGDKPGVSVFNAGIEVRGGHFGFGEVFSHKFFV